MTVDGDGIARGLDQCIRALPYSGRLTLEDRTARSVRATVEQQARKVKITGPWSLGLNGEARVDSRCDAFALAW